MSELAVAALRLGLLLVLWILIISIVSSQGRDLMVGRRNKVRPQAAAAPAARPASSTAAPVAEAPGQATPGGGQQAAPRPLPRQLEVTEGPLSGQVIDLHGEPLMLGRAQEADLVLDDDYVSGRHARLFPQGSRWFLEDLGSTNGTYVGGSQLARTVAVDPGTPIRIGKTVLVLRP
ncbi:MULTISPECIES: FHA domain-containing protein FhaB/FipA [Micrococcus]|uniref:FHA domain-containing protein n=1 Tax=Micrococcus terreus TaxID=574650 RepID=A0A1I7MRN2_9MICC|nr:FHA domain-containing protein [Micrococcus terreus]MCT2088889.1 FHA domain-containing protein [Micrococcus terreus]SFV24584.1 FHA domain-containing protein [Micrococcus terreus]